jgi:methylase of polypeptide subunit release factors
MWPARRSRRVSTATTLPGGIAATPGTNSGANSGPIPGPNRAPPTEPTDAALLALLQALRRRDYRFVTVTPATHARMVARERGLAREPGRSAADLRDIFGWSLPFAPESLDPDILALLTAAEALDPAGGGRFKSRYRISELGGDLFLHSAYPTTAEDAVFFGPDSYRFADLVQRELRREPPRRGARLVDIGAGAGVGAIAAARLCPALRSVMTDINPEALRLAGINARAAGIGAEFALGTDLDAVAGPIDLALANPPYIIDAAGRDYRDGGDMHGGRVACDMAAAALGQLAPEGRLILYTGSAIIAGDDPLRAALAALAARHGCTLRYREIDPDVFGEELEKAAYREVERIALVAAVISRTDSRMAD